MNLRHAVHFPKSLKKSLFQTMQNGTYLHSFKNMSEPAGLTGNRWVDRFGPAIGSGILSAHAT